MEDSYGSFIAKGNEFSKEQNYGKAIECFYDALLDAVDKYGEMGAECVDAYYFYGKSLVDNYRANACLFNSLLGDSGTRTDSDSESFCDGTGNGDGNRDVNEDANVNVDVNANVDVGVNVNSVSAAAVEVDREGSRNDGLESAEAGNSRSSYRSCSHENQDSKQGLDVESEDSVDSQGMCSDLRLAWYNLDIARVLYAKRDDQESKVRLAETHLQLGLVHFESGMEDEAVSEVLTGLGILQASQPDDSKVTAQLAFELASIYLYSSSYEEASKYFGVSRSIMLKHLDGLKRDFSKNHKEIEGLNDIITQLDDKIGDCLSSAQSLACRRSEEVSNNSGNAGHANCPEVPAKDASHLVKRKNDDKGDDQVKRCKGVR